MLIRNRITNREVTRRGADKSLARPTSRCRRTETVVSLERGGLFMCQIASLFLLQGLKGSMSGDARHFNNNQTRAVIKFFFFPARQGAEGNSLHSDRNIRGTCTIVCHRQWVAQFKRGDFSTCDAPRPGWTDKFLNFFEWLANVRATG